MAGTAVTVSRISAQLSDSKPLAFEAEPEDEVTTLALSSPWKRGQTPAFRKNKSD